MSKSLWFAAIALPAIWIGLAVMFAWQCRWNFSQVSPNAEYWGQIFGVLMAYLGNLLLFVALVDQRKQLRTQEIEAGKTLKLVEEQSRQLAFLAESSRSQLELSKVLPLIELRASLIDTYYRQKGHGEVRAVKAQIAAVQTSLAKLLESVEVSPAVKAALEELGRPLQLSDAGTAMPINPP